ncbi:hypothetical protein [Albidovulum sp.]
MAEKLIQVATNEKLTRIAHWTVFGLGVLSLGFAVAATAANAF